MRSLALCTLACAALLAEERAVDPTFLRRSISAVMEKPSDVSTVTCHYKPLFGAGDSQAKALKGIARFGEITVDAGGASKSVAYAREEQAYFIEEGSGELQFGDGRYPVRRNDFFYIPAGVGHGLANAGKAPLRAIVMGFTLPPGVAGDASSKPQIANTDDVKLQLVGGHPASTLYQLLIGDTHSTRDKIAAGHVLTSLFIMEIAPGGTNFPHHHEREEEIYLLLDGTGEMVAGGGMDGVEGRHAAKAGDAYFIRLNATVGFYNSHAPGAPKARVLAVRSLFPFGKN
jgi:mannose-6-phosphate isomerase-like protein (cupin superfamily)